MVGQEDISSSVEICWNYHDATYRWSSISQNSLHSPALQSACIPCSGTSESSRAGSLTCGGVISQEQEEHRGGKHRHTGDQLKPEQVSCLSLYIWCLTDFGLHSQPVSISRIFLDADFP